MRVYAALVVVVLALAGCTVATGDNESATTSPGVPTSNVDVDTPELRALKAEIGMADCPTTTKGAVDGGLPDLTLPCLGGGTDVNLSELRGPMVLNLWASNCAPCRKEMPLLQQLHEDYDDVLVLGVNYQERFPDFALKLADEVGATYPSVADPGGNLAESKAAGNIVGLPWTVFVDAGGTVQGIKPGEITSYAALQDLVAEHLGVNGS